MKKLLFVIVVTLLLVGCGENKEVQKARAETTKAKAEIQKTQQQTDIKEEYSRYVNDVNSASTEAQIAMTKWNTLMEQYNQGYDISLDDLKTAKSDYELEANKLAPKIDALLAFIEKNNDKLLETVVTKDDLFKEKSELNDFKAEIATNKEQMKEEYGKVEGNS